MRLNLFLIPRISRLFPQREFVIFFCRFSEGFANDATSPFSNFYGLDFLRRVALRSRGLSYRV
jgi:hypothetical protein